MNTASSASQNARETANAAREAVREVSKAASDNSSDMKVDMQALRDDFRRLTDQVADLVAGQGNAAWQRAKSTMDEAVAEAQGKGRDALDAVREVSDHFVEALDDSLKARPYTTLALVAGMAFVLGVTWRR